MFLIQLYIEDMSRLQAADNLERIMEVGLGTGSIKNANAVRHSLMRQARKGIVMVIRADPSTLAGIGIGFKKCQKN